MNAPTPLCTYRVLASDNLVYGPIDWQTLCQWTVDERILPETWIMRLPDNHWMPAAYLADLRPHFPNFSTPARPATAVEAKGEVQPQELRQFELFAGISNEQIATFLEFAEFIPCNPNHLLIKKGDVGDAIYFLLSGTVRARILVAHEEKLLTTIESGGFFGEVAMFTHSARSADVVVVEPSRLLRVSAQAFIAMSQKIPDLACPILLAMSRSLASRVADLTVKLSHSEASARLWS